MTSVFWLLIVLLLAVIAAGVLIVYLRQRDQARREAIEALAARRGWSLMITRQSLGRPSILRLSSRSAPVWHAERKRFDADAGTKAQSITEYHSTAVSWDENLMVVCHADSADPQTDSDGLADPEAIQALVGQDIGDSIPPLHAWPTHDHMTVFASSDPTLRTDMGDLAKVFLDWTPLKTGPRGQAVLILGGTGLRVRLRHSVNGADGLERFIDYSTALYRHFSRP